MENKFDKSFSIEKKKNQSENIGYAGDIEVNIMHGKRLIEQKKFHNTGCRTLFNFIASCLKGNWSQAAENRPYKLAAFTKDPQEDIEHKVFNVKYWNEAHKVSSTVIYEESPSILPITENGEVVGYKTTFKFRLPYLSLVDGATINKFALYPKTFTDLATDMCAYYILSPAEEIKIPDYGVGGGGNFTIIILWSLKIKNA